MPMSRMVMSKLGSALRARAAPADASPDPMIRARDTGKPPERCSVSIRDDDAGPNELALLGDVEIVAELFPGPSIRST